MPKLLAYSILAHRASIGMAWSIFTLWQKEKGESGEFESKSVLASPEAEPLMETTE